MQVVVLLLLVASLALLVSGLITGGTPLVIASIAASVLAGYAISRYRGRQPAGGSSRGRPGAGGSSRGRPRAGAGAAPAGASAAPAGTPSAGRTAEPAWGASEPVRAVPEPALAGADLPAARRVPDGSGGKHSQAAPDVLVDDDPPMAETDPPLRSRGDEQVWVIDGRPRYHLAGCGFLLGRDPEPVPLRQAVEDGFTPCALCDPDSGLAPGPGRS